VVFWAFGKRGVTIEVLVNSTEVAAEPNEAYSKVIDSISSWWPKDLSLHPGEAPSFAVVNEHKVGGVVFEKWGDIEDGALWGHIISIKRGEWFELAGPMGLKGPPSGIVEFLFEKASIGTQIKINHIGPFRDADHRDGVNASWQKIMKTLDALF
jgi:hypothetical protein